MKRKPETKCSRWIITTIVLTLTVLWSFGGLWLASADDPGAICVMRIASDTNPIFNVLVDQQHDFNFAVSTPARKVIKVPVRCDMLETLALGVANQGDSTTKLTVKLYTNAGGLFCSKGPFDLAAHGSQGVIFSDCQF
jgi:hypothetical protein